MVGLAGCGSGSKNTVKIVFGKTGGLLVPYQITIAPSGAIRVKGTPPVTPPKSLTHAQDEKLSGLVRDAMGKLESQQCPRTFPDEAAEFIQAMGKQVIVRGSCDADFTKLWNALTNELGLNQ